MIAAVREMRIPELCVEYTLELLVRQRGPYSAGRPATTSRTCRARSRRART